MGFEEAILKVTDELKKEGFGIFTEIDVTATLKKKLDVDFRNYRILGACSQEMSLLCLHLLQASLVYINTLMIQQVLKEPGWLNKMTPRDLAALSPLITQHINPYGRFELDMEVRLPIAV